MSEMIKEEMRAFVARTVRDRVACVAGWSGFEAGSIDRMIDQIADRVAEGLASGPPAGPDVDLAEALDRLHRCMVHDARDWSLYKRDALSYALVVGWSDDAGWADVAAKHGWSADDVSELQRLHAAIDRRKGLHRSESAVDADMDAESIGASSPRDSSSRNGRSDLRCHCTWY